jgi:hypothetical protein
MNGAANASRRSGAGDGIRLLKRAARGVLRTFKFIQRPLDVVGGFTQAKPDLPLNLRVRRIEGLEERCEVRAHVLCACAQLANAPDDCAM